MYILNHQHSITITDGTVTINEPSLYLTLLENGQMPPLEINTNWDYEDFDGPDFRSTPINPNPSQYYIDGAGVLNIIPFSALIQNNSRVIEDRRRFKVPRHVDIPSDPKKSPNINRFGTTLVKSMNLQRNQVIFDSGASTCATSDKSILRNIVSCDNIKAYPAFGPPVQTKGVGQYGPLGLDMILLDDMKETLVSISELCKGGLLNKQNIVVFTWEGMRAFEMNEASRKAMKTLLDDGTVIVRSYQENEVYCTQTK